MTNTSTGPAQESRTHALIRRGLERLADDDGAATAEYAITTMATVEQL